MLCPGGPLHVHRSVYALREGVCGVKLMSLLSHCLSFNLTFHVPIGRCPPGINQSRSPQGAEIKSASQQINLAHKHTHTHTHTAFWSCWMSLFGSECAKWDSKLNLLQCITSQSVSCHCYDVWLFWFCVTFSPHLFCKNTFILLIIFHLPIFSAVWKEVGQALLLQWF